MSNQEQRYSEYLGSYHFFPNSIEFRIVSSKALEKFKNVQSFQLNQLVNGKFFFPQDRREILLLKYDMWSRWLTEIENLFIELHETSDGIRQKDIDAVVDLAQKTANKYVTIIKEEHNAHFEPEFADLWIQSHDASFKFLLDSFRKLNGSYELSFIKIVDLLCEALQYTLAEIHEMNEMFKDSDNTSAFIVVTDLCKRVERESGKILAAKRLTTYKRKFNITNVWFKNYTDEPISSNLVSAIEEVGVQIDYKRCIFN
jgi:anion-transporting  ArsA/GET3 family ATPase